MKINPLKIHGSALIEIEPITDERGFFARSYCQQEFQDAGIDLTIKQTNLSQNEHKGTLRGMHFQASPRFDAKLVSCIAGEIFDVIVDLRIGSETYCQWIGVQLTEGNYKALYVPPGCAHGFMTLSDNALVHYQMGEVFVADLARGVRWNDPAFAIDWPLEPLEISDRDAAYPDFQGGL